MLRKESFELGLLITVLKKTTADNVQSLIELGLAIARLAGMGSNISPCLYEW